MGLTDVIVIAVLIAILGGAAWYVYKAKKSGKKCIGCPDGCSCDCSKTCSGHCSGCQHK